MDPSEVRARSQMTAREMGFETSAALPLLEVPRRPRNLDEILGRLLCLHCVAACAYGLDRARAAGWLAHEGLEPLLTATEAAFLRSGTGDGARFRVAVESIWVLAWELQLVATLDFSRQCDGRFVELMPNLKSGDSSLGLRSRVSLRPVTELFAACDLAFCLHWTVRDRALRASHPPRKDGLAQGVISARRHALEWSLFGEDWDEISLDT